MDVFFHVFVILHCGKPFHVYVFGLAGAAVAGLSDILKVPAILIKAVTNVVDGGKPSIVEYRQNLAAVTAGLGLAVKLISSMGSASLNLKLTVAFGIPLIWCDAE
ncbi:hypothetical protein Vadar_021498 [Vaccinium darrowii]|uniref:Uncharacterized protein n=1 Tax=Vaccinium darrowii TaxID=229202 RepID=A0ACB7YXQ9_9ERIC|nr:hypothetical protein Vadar_021498 [Vaccinium darrowii]